MLLIDREIVEARRPTEGESDRVHARRLADAHDAVLDCRPQRVVAADDIVVVDDVIRMPPRRRDRGHMDQRIAALESIEEPLVFADIGLNER
jgi:hypothetical protein